MHNDEKDLDRVRHILSKMERSITDARSKRLGDTPNQSQPNTGNAHNRDAQPSTTNTPNHPRSDDNAGNTATADSGKLRFDEDGRPIVGRARPKQDRGNGGPSSSAWR